MKTSLIAIFLMTSASAFAGSYASDDQANRTGFAGQLTRAEVKADLADAKASGQLRTNEYAAYQQPSKSGERARMEVRAEAVQASRTHANQYLF